MFSLYLQAIFLIFCVVAGFLIAIPVGISKSNFNGSCLLYAKFFKSYSNRHHKHFQSGSIITCNFCIFSGSISVTMALVLLAGTFYLIWRKHFGNFSVSSEVDRWQRHAKSPSKPLVGAWIHFCASVVLALLLFVAGCLISFGFHSFCEDGLKKHHQELESCSVLEPLIGSFYKEFSISQVSAWLGAICWLVLVVIGRMNVRNLKPKRLPTLSSENNYHQIVSPVHQL